VRRTAKVRNQGRGTFILHLRKKRSKERALKCCLRGLTRKPTPKKKASETRIRGGEKERLTLIFGFGGEVEPTNPGFVYESRKNCHPKKLKEQEFHRVPGRTVEEVGRNGRAIGERVRSTWH